MDIYILSIPSMNNKRLKDLFTALPDRYIILLEDINTAGATYSRESDTEDSDSDGEIRSPKKKR